MNWGKIRNSPRRPECWLQHQTSTSECLSLGCFSKNLQFSMLQFGWEIPAKGLAKSQLWSQWEIVDRRSNSMGIQSGQRKRGAGYGWSKFILAELPWIPNHPTITDPKPPNQTITLYYVIQVGEYQECFPLSCWFWWMDRVFKNFGGEETIWCSPPILSKTPQALQQVSIYRRDQLLCSLFQ